MRAGRAILHLTAGSRNSDDKSSYPEHLAGFDLFIGFLPLDSVSLRNKKVRRTCQAGRPHGKEKREPPESAEV